MLDQDLWGWPVSEVDLEGFSRFESPVHRLVPKYIHSVDFMVPLGSVVLAIAAGEVTYVKQDSSEGGSDLDGLDDIRNSYYWDRGNRVEILHGDGVHTGYEHLSHQESLVCVGERVRKGQPIATTGYTGLMAHLGPHLHVEKLVYIGDGDDDIKTLRMFLV